VFEHIKTKKKLKYLFGKGGFFVYIVCYNARCKKQNSLTYWLSTVLTEMAWMHCYVLGICVLSFLADCHRHLSF